MVTDRDAALALIAAQLDSAPPWPRSDHRWDCAEVVGLTRASLKTVWHSNPSGKPHQWTAQTMEWVLAREPEHWPALVLTWTHTERRGGGRVRTPLGSRSPLGQETYLVHASLASALIERLLAETVEPITDDRARSRAPRPAQVVGAHWTRDGKFTAPSPAGVSLATDVLRPRAVALGGSS